MKELKFITTIQNRTVEENMYSYLKCLTVPEHGKGFVVATGDQRHLNAFATDLITVKAADGTYGLLQE